MLRYCKTAFSSVQFEVMATRDNKGRFVKAGVKRTLDNLSCRSKEKEGNEFKEGEEKVEVKWNDGRRVVDLGVLAESLQECSSSVCCLPLHLKNIESETRVGLGSVLWVRCECGEVNSVNTSKEHGKSKGMPLYDVNTKFASGLIHSGVSFVAGKRLLENLEIPPPSYSCIKRRETLNETAHFQI